MDIVALAGMVFVLLMTGMIGGFVLLFPLTRRLGELLEQRLLQAKQAAGVDPQAVAALRRTVHALEAEIERLAEHQAFTQALLESGDAGQPTSAGAFPGGESQPPRA